MADCNTCRTSRTGGEIDAALKFIKCTNFTVRNIDMADVASYAQRSGAVGPDQLCFVHVCLLSGRLIYWKNQPGDCPQETKINLGISQQATKYGSLAGTGLGATASIAAIAGHGTIGAAGFGAGAAGAAGTAAAAATVVGLALIPLVVWGMISAHHKIAVAREQATICDVSQAYNKWEEVMESGIVLGQTAVSDAKSALNVIEPQLLQSLQAIVKGGCNAACYYQKGIRALNMYATEKLYDSLQPKRYAVNPANPLGGIGIKSPLPKYLTAGAAAIAAAKIAGALI